MSQRALGPQFTVDHHVTPAPDWPGGLSGGEVTISHRFKQVARLAYADTEVNDGVAAIHVGGVGVDAPFRGRGLAAAMYDRIHQDTGKPFVHGADNQSLDGYGIVSHLAERHPGRHLWYTSPDGETASLKRPKYPYPGGAK